MKYLTSVLTMVLSLCLPFEPATAKECASLKATGNPEYPPYLWRAASDGQTLVGAVGFIIEELSRRLDRTIDIKYVGAWSRAQAEVKSGNYDLIAGAFYTIPRNQWMDYVYPPFLTTSSVVWSNTDKPLEYSERAHLIGKTGVTVIKNSFGQEFDDFAKKHLQVEQVASLEQAFKMLALGRVDYALYEKNPGLAYASSLGVNEQLSTLDPPVSSEPLHLTISHKSRCNTPQLRGELAKHLREMENEGFHQKALELGLSLWEQEKPK